MKFGAHSKLGKNALANEENSNYVFSARRHNRCALLGLSRSQPTRADGGGDPTRAISLGCYRYPGIRCGGSCRCVSLACSAEGPGNSPEFSASIRPVPDWYV